MRVTKPENTEACLGVASVQTPWSLCVRSKSSWRLLWTCRCAKTKLQSSSTLPLL